MASLDDVRRIALGFAGVTEQAHAQGGGVAWRVKAGTFVWERPPRARDVEQLAALGREWPRGTVIAVRTDDVGTVAALVETDSDVFFTIPHFDGYPAVLVRLGAIGIGRLGELITEGWFARAPKGVAAAWLAEHPAG